MKKMIVTEFKRHNKENVHNVQKCSDYQKC